MRRNYGLFIKVGRRWVRLYPKIALPKETAIRVFQSMLIHFSLTGKCVELRPIK